MTTPSDIPSDLQLHQMSERFLDAMLSSADPDTVGPARWWDRAVSALETGAAGSTSFRQTVARAGKRLQITAFNPATAVAVAELAETLDDPRVFARWRQLVKRDATVIAGMVRNQRQQRHQQKGTPQ